MIVSACTGFRWRTVVPNTHCWTGGKLLSLVWARSREALAILMALGSLTMPMPMPTSTIHIHSGLHWLPTWYEAHFVTYKDSIVENIYCMCTISYIHPLDRHRINISLSIRYYWSPLLYFNYYYISQTYYFSINVLHAVNACACHVIPLKEKAWIYFMLLGLSPLS